MEPQDPPIPRPGWSGFDSWLGVGNFSLLHRVRTGSGAYPASYTGGTRAFSLWIKRPGHEADNSHPSSAEVNAWSYTSIAPVRLHGMVLSEAQGQLHHFNISLRPHPTPTLDYHPLSAVRDSLFNIIAVTLHIWRPSAPSANRWRAMPWWQGTT
jgi:hypothetical protein